VQPRCCARLRAPLLPRLHPAVGGQQGDAAVPRVPRGGQGAAAGRRQQRGACCARAVCGRGGERRCAAVSAGCVVAGLCQRQWRSSGGMWRWCVACTCWLQRRPTHGVALWCRHRPHSQRVQRPPLQVRGLGCDAVRRRHGVRAMLCCAVRGAQCLVAHRWCTVARSADRRHAHTAPVVSLSLAHALEQMLSQT
jgi:hypothetical protein